MEGDSEEGLEKVKGFGHMNICRKDSQVEGRAVQRLWEQECPVYLRNIKEAHMTRESGKDAKEDLDSYKGLKQVGLC